MTNKSATYLLPLVFKHVSVTQIYNYIVETYLYNYNNFENYNLHLKVLKLPESLLNDLTNNDMFVGLLNNDDHQLLTFKLNKRFYYDYDCLQQGKYSKFKDESKDIILKYWSNLAKKI